VSEAMEKMKKIENEFTWSRDPAWKRQEEGGGRKEAGRKKRKMTGENCLLLLCVWPEEVGTLGKSTGNFMHYAQKGTADKRGKPIREIGTEGGEVLIKMRLQSP